MTSGGAGQEHELEEGRVLIHDVEPAEPQRRVRAS